MLAFTEETRKFDNAGRQTFPRPSLNVLATGGTDLRDRCKADSLGTVKVVTDDAEIAVGYLLNKGNIEIKVCHCVGFMHDEWNIGRRQTWQVVTVFNNRIKELRSL